MKNKLFSLILMFCLCFTVVSCSSDDDGGNDEPQTIAVSSAVGNIKRDKDYRIQIEAHLTETTNGSKTYENDYKIVMLTKDNMRKVELTFNEFVISLYTIIENEIQYIVFNPSVITDDSLDKWVKLTEEELVDLFGEEYVESTTTSFSLFEELFQFFIDIKDEYFILNSVGNYEFNQSGKDAIAEIVRNKIEIPETESNYDIDSKCTIRVNKKYITNLITNIYINALNTQDNITLESITSLDKFNEVEIKFPNETITYQEFKEYLSQ